MHDNKKLSMHKYTRVTHQYPDTLIFGHLYLLNGRSSDLCFIPKDSSLYNGLATGKRAAVGGACENGGTKYAPSEKNQYSDK